jgi:hypothetical protein
VYMQGSSKLHGLHTSLAGVISVYVLKRAQQTRRAELRWCVTVCGVVLKCSRCMRIKWKLHFSKVFLGENREVKLDTGVALVNLSTCFAARCHLMLVK